ncbi:MAG TPA: DEAD/DEAH box helicase [Candidatus Omnitrophota bacterium]|nr:DEAD/DEAH box helicase [Candidatus Omnitrophota bacterium]
MNHENSHNTFYGLGIAPGILDVLDRMKFVTPTPIQFKAIPVAIEGKDLVGIAQTGTGKTLAFGIPMVQRLAQVPGKALVLVPTRELAIQVDEALRSVGQPFNIRTAVLIGGMNMGTQIQVIRKSTTRIIVATPGRLLDHIQQKTIHLNDVKMVVLDEADRMLDMGFAPQIQRVMQSLPRDRQTLLFSATMPDDIVRIATQYMKLPIRVEVARAGTAAEKVIQELFIVKQESKRELLLKLLKQYHGSVLIFARTKIGAQKLTRALREAHNPAAEIHSDRSLGQRREALEGFKMGRYRILVATDIAARGIDVKGIELVINYDLPDDSENYVHRIGRTGRAGHEGRAISLATPDQSSQVRDIERLMRTTLAVASHPEIPPANFFKPVVVASYKPSRFGARRARRRR